MFLIKQTSHVLLYIKIAGKGLRGNWWVGQVTRLARMTSCRTWRNLFGIVLYMSLE